MALTKISRGLLNTGVSDSSDANAITISSAEKVTVANSLNAPTSIQTPLIEFTDGDDAITIADGGAVTTAGNLTATGNLTVGGNLTVTGTSTVVDTVTMNAQNAVVFEGATADGYETTLSVVDPAGSDKTQYLINQTGYIPLLAAVTTTAITSTPAELNILDGVTSTAAELNLLDGSVANTVVNSKGVIYGSSGELAGTLSTAAQTNVTSLGTLTSLNVDNLTLNGSSITSDTNLTMDVVGDINLDADGGETRLKDAGTEWGVFSNSSSNFKIQASIQDADIIFTGNDGGVAITALTLDMSDGGGAHFTNDIYIADNQAVRFGNDQDFRIYNDNSHTTLHNSVSNQDMLFKGNDGGSAITALTLDMSAAGAATFLGAITAGDHITLPATKRLYLDGSGDTFIEEVAANKIAFTTGNSERMRINSDNKVGIGSSPSNFTAEYLNITTPSSGGGQGISFKRLDSNSDQQVGSIRFANNSTDDLSIIKVITDGANTSSRMHLQTNTGSGLIDTLVLQSSGYVDFTGAADLRVTLGTQGTAGTNDANWIRGAADVIMYNSGGSDHRWEVGGGEKMRLTSDGDFGIGCTPGSGTRLEIRDTANDTKVEISGTDGRGLMIHTEKSNYPTDSGQNDAVVVYNAQDTESSAIYPGHVFQYGGNEAMRIQRIESSGNTGAVGIGGINPSYTLDVNTNGESNAMRIEQATNTKDLAVFWKNHGTGTGDDTSLSMYTAAGAGDPYIRLSITGNEHYDIRLDNSDADKFKIMNQNDTRMTMYGGNTHFSETDSDCFIYLGSHGGQFGGNSSVNMRNSGGNLMFNVPSAKQHLWEINGGEVMRLQAHTAGGSLGVGCTARGDMHFSSGTGTTGEDWGFGGGAGNTVFYVIDEDNAGVYLSHGGSSWQSHSDERIKENIVSLGTVMPDLKNMRCVKYNRIGNSETQIGFIAQDWESKFSEVVDEDDGFVIDSGKVVKPDDSESNTKIKSISYTETIPVLLKAIQELEEKLNIREGELEQRVHELEQRLV